MTNDPDSQTPSDERKPSAVERPGAATNTKDPATSATLGPTPGIPLAASLPARGRQDSQSENQNWALAIAGAFNNLDDSKSVSDVSEYSLGSTSPRAASGNHTRPADGLTNDLSSIGSHTDQPEEWDVLGMNESQLPADLKSLLQNIEDKERNDVPAAQASVDPQPLAELERRIQRLEERFGAAEMKLIKKLGAVRYREGFDERYEAHQYVLEKLRQHYGERTSTPSSGMAPTTDVQGPAATAKNDQPEVAEGSKANGAGPTAAAGKKASPDRAVFESQDLTPLPWSPPREKMVARSGSDDRSEKSNASSVTMDSSEFPTSRQAPVPQTSERHLEGFQARVAAAEARLNLSVSQVEIPTSRAAGKSRPAPEPDDLWDDDESSAPPEPVRATARRRRTQSQPRNTPAEPDAAGWFTARRGAAPVASREQGRADTGRPAENSEGNARQAPAPKASGAQSTSSRTSSSDDNWSISSLVIQAPPLAIVNLPTRTRSPSLSDLSDDGLSSGEPTQSTNLLPPPAKRTRTDERDRSSGNTR